MDELFEMEKKEERRPKQIGHLYRKLFLLVFGIALLAQGLLWVEKGLSSYYAILKDSFKVVLTVNSQASSEQLEQWAQQLDQKPQVASVRLFSAEEALSVVHHQNPQLVESLLIMGQNQIPAYFELRIPDEAINNIRAFTDNLAVEYEDLEPHYNQQHARLLFYTGLYTKLLRVLGLLALLVFVAFMFLVEATPTEHANKWGGLFSGLLAGGLAGGLLGAVLYPTGLLAEVIRDFTTWPRQALLISLCGLLGWALSKWQRF